MAVNIGVFHGNLIIWIILGGSELAHNRTEKQVFFFKYVM